MRNKAVQSPLIRYQVGGEIPVRLIGGPSKRFHEFDVWARSAQDAADRARAMRPDMKLSLVMEHRSDWQ
jgi:hypothetical protein